MHTATILVADDETHILNVVSIKLQNAGFRVLTAEDGAEAHAQAVAHQPDLIITDFQMPRLSGLELACRLHRDPLTRDIPVVLLTARGFDLPIGGAARHDPERPLALACPLPRSDRRDRISGNIRRIISKPFSPRQILACVQELLAESVVQ